MNLDSEIIPIIMLSILSMGFITFLLFALREINRQYRKDNPHKVNA